MDRADHMILATICAGAFLRGMGRASEDAANANWIAAVIGLSVAGIAALYFVKCIRKALEE